MHEMGIMSAMLNTLDGILKEEEVNSVNRIVMQIGEISGVIPHYIEECYQAVAYGTKYENTKLEIEVIPGIVRCEDCKEEFNGMRYDLHCPSCKGEHLTALTGRELMIKEVEVS